VRESLVVLLHVESGQPLDRLHTVERIEEEPLVLERTPPGTCLLSGEVTKSLIVATSLDVTRCGEVLGHDEWSSRSQPRSARFHAWNLDGDRPIIASAL
jgi:hypothetical protein